MSALQSSNRLIGLVTSRNERNAPKKVPSRMFRMCVSLRVPKDAALLRRRGCGDKVEQSERGCQELAWK